MDEKSQTIFTKLNNIMTRNSGLVQPEFDDIVTLKGKSPEDIQKQYNELKQSKYLSDQFFSVEKSHLMQVMHYEAQRLHAFTDYEGMEYYPLIASALDLYMEEATTIGENGKMLNIYSKSPRIKTILEDLFYDVLNINVNLPSWTRSTIKYGDNFLYLGLEKGKGITMVKQLLNMTVERKEEITADNKLRVFFKKRDSGQEMSRIEIAHFRLLGDDKYLPYGSSVLNKIRKYWRMCLHEDTNILTENGLVKIKDINPNDIVYSYDYENDIVIKTKVKKKIHNGEKITYKVKSKAGEIILTNDHPILIKNSDGFSYKNINQINIEYDFLVSPNINEDIINILNILEIIEYGISNVYDIEIDHETHNFIAENIVVHNCILAEDAMLSNRILRAGDKRVIKVDVGNMATEDILPYMENFAKSMKRKPTVNPTNGSIDYRFNILGNDEDLYLPVRNGNNGTVIETLEGSSTLDKIQDIEYLRDLLFTGLGIPKPFLGYQATAGDGKNVTQLDMRFSKKVNRIQQALIQELSNIAMVHLYLLGFEDDFDNFDLALSPPSTQADILKVELLQSKVQLYNEMTLPTDNGIAATSHSYAKINVFNWSEDDIIKDLERQYMERIVTQEIQNATNNVSKSGIFDDLLAKFGLKPGEQAIGGVQGEDGDDGGGMSSSVPDISDITQPSTKAESMNILFGNKSKEEIKKDVLIENSKKLQQKSEKTIKDIESDDNLNK